MSQIDQVLRVIGKWSIASVRSWLRSQQIDIAVSKREVIAEKIAKLIEEGKITLDALELGLIDIEEASRKRIYLYAIDVTSQNIKKIDKQLAALGVNTVQRPVAAPSTPSTTRRVYAMNDSNRLRVKWAETHLSYIQDLTTLQLVPTKLTKVIVLNLDKTIGVAQLRYDKPETTHPHGSGGKSTPSEYFAHFKEVSENLIGLGLESLDLRPGLAKLMNTSPRIVEVGSNEQLTEDGYTIKLAPKRKGKDVRDAKDFGAMSQHGVKVRVHEVESVNWLVGPANNAITRRVFSHIDGRESYVRFDAHCHEAEIQYVLSQLV